MLFELISALVLLFVLGLITSAIVQAIWNKILIKKFPSSNIQPLSLIEAFAIYVLCGILFKGSAIYKQVTGKTIKDVDFKLNMNIQEDY